MRALAILAVVCATAAAEPPKQRVKSKIKLRLERQPPQLHMRPRAAAVVPAAGPSAPARTGAAPGVTAPTASALDIGADADFVRDVQRPVSARFNLGYVVDGTAFTGKTGYSSPDTSSINQLRAYALGEGFISTQGVAAASLSTYIAARFQLVPQHHVRGPDGSEVPTNPPVATWFDRSGIEPRNLWAEVKDFLPDPRFAPLRIRAGELYVYGPWMMHMYGANAAWEDRLVKANVYVGTRVPDYTLGNVAVTDRALITGASLRMDLRALKKPIPFSVAGEVLNLAAVGSATGQSSRSTQLEVDWRPRQDVALIAQARSLDEQLANEHFQLRSRYGQVTNLVFDITHRHDTDWRWDPSVLEPDPLAAKRYLDLGPVLPQLLASARAGTLIKENIDVYVRAAAASDLAGPGDPRSTYAASYLEVGGAVELRLRRTIALGASGLTRETTRYTTVSGQINDVPGTPQMLPTQSSPDIGEKGITEGGATLRMTLGARKLSALVEFYSRRTEYAPEYCAAVSASMPCNSAINTGIHTTDYRWGGRVTVDAWVGPRLHVFAAYELSSALKYQPEITGYKSLELVMEAIY